MLILATSYWEAIKDVMPMALAGAAAGVVVGLIGMVKKRCPLCAEQISCLARRKCPKCGGKLN